MSIVYENGIIKTSAGKELSVEELVAVANKGIAFTSYNVKWQSPGFIPPEQNMRATLPSMKEFLKEVE